MSQIRVVRSMVVVAALAGCSVTSPTGTADPKEARIASLIGQMTLDEKLGMLGGDQTGFASPGVPRLGIPPLIMSDGPNGVREGKSTAFPASVAMAASFDVDLILRYGAALAEQTSAKGRNVILGPCVGIHRFPLGGRNFESFGEDPFLSGAMAEHFVRGVQSRGVLATVKHFAANDQEWSRNTYDVQVDERTLREIHLAPFEAAVKRGGVLAVMTAYNKVNGQYCSENTRLVRDILKDEWGFPGIVMSDWISVYGAETAAMGGLDLEMPHPVWFGDKLRAAVDSGAVPISVIDDKVRRHLRVRLSLGFFERPLPKVDEEVVRSDRHSRLAREMAEQGMVLLKNDGVLPLDGKRLKTVAMIGPAATIARTGGGGSAHVEPWRSTSPAQGMATLLGPGVEIRTAEGVRLDPVKPSLLPASFVRAEDGSPGLTGRYYANEEFAGEPVFTRVDPAIDFNLPSDKPLDPRLPPTHYSVRWTGKLIVPNTGRYRLATSSDDGSMLYINGKVLVDNWGQHAEQHRFGELDLVAGQAYDLRVDFYQAGGGHVMRLGWVDLAEEESNGSSLEKAVAAAQGADVAVVCVGNTHHLEGEGQDVEDFELSGQQGKLVSAVVAANPNTVVVVYGGVPVRMKEWLVGARAVIAAFYPGQEGGLALGNILLGTVNPSAKLPFSYIQDKSESPAFAGYRDPSLKVAYSEGVFVGYRWHDQAKTPPLFPFGHGLSYTTFAYSQPRVTKDAWGVYTVEVDVTNTGKWAGAEVVQVYVAPRTPTVRRPVRELKGFGKITLMPGASGTVRIPLDDRAFRYFHPDKRAWTVEKGAYEIQVGASSRDIRGAAVVDL